MSLIQKATIVLGSFLFATVCLAAGAAPSNVAGVQAEYANGSIIVRWSPAQDASGIGSYRIYFSHQSILGNSGNYDDFQQTPSAETSYAFAVPPVKEGTVYFSVMAVNKNGVESDGFESEASVEIPKTTIETPPVEPVILPTEPSVTETAPIQENPATTDIPMEITNAAAVSSTGILVTFSKPIAAGTDIGAASFILADSGGILLPIERIEVSGLTVLLITKPQEPARPYTLGITQPISAEDGTGASPGSSQPIVNGFGEPIVAAAIASSSSSLVTEEVIPETQPAPVPVQEPAAAVPYGKNPLIGGSQIPYGVAPMFLAPEDGTNLVLQPIRQKNGLYNVIASWAGSVDSKRILAAYGLYTSTDGSRFDWNSVVDPNQTSVQFSRVRPGTFGLRVTAKDAKGNESRGISQVIVLPASGVGFLGIIIASGAYAGRSLKRRKRSVA
jgi:hypothetical protein